MIAKPRVLANLSAIVALFASIGHAVRLTIQAIHESDPSTAGDFRRSAYAFAAIFIAWGFVLLRPRSEQALVGREILLMFALDGLILFIAIRSVATSLDGIPVLVLALAAAVNVVATAFLALSRLSRADSGPQTAGRGSREGTR